MLPQPERPRVLILGGRRLLADALVARLSESHAVTSLQHGDAIEDHLHAVGADTIIILEAAEPPIERGGPPRYRNAAAAVSHGSAGTTPPVITLTCLPPRGAERGAALELYETTESNLRAAGVRLVVIRYCGIIGSPQIPGPSDPFLFSRLTGSVRGGYRRRISVASPGDQTWSPTSTDALAALAAAAATAAPGTILPGTYRTGDSACTVMSVLAIVNGAGTRYRRIPLWLWGHFAARFHIPDRTVDLSHLPWAPASLTASLPTIAELWLPDAVRRREALATSDRWRKAYQSESAHGLIAYFMMLTAAPVGCVGLVDALFTSDVASRIRGMLLVGAGCLMVVARRALRARSRSRFVLGFLASIVIVLVCVTVLVTSTVSGGGYAGIAYGTIVWAIIGGIIAATLWRRGGLAATQLARRGAPAFVTSVVTVSTIAGLGQFWYQNVYLPHQGEPVINIDATLRKHEMFRGRRTVDAVIRLRNPAPNPVVVAGSHFDITALRAATRTQGVSNPRETFGRRDQPFGRRDPLRKADVVRSGEVVEPTTVLAANAEVSRRFVVAMGRRETGALMRVSLVTLNRHLGQVDLDIGHARVDHRAQVVYRTIDINETSSLWHWLTHGSRQLYTIEALEAGGTGCVCAGVAVLQAYISGAKKETDVSRRVFPACASGSPRFDYYYGVNGESAATEVALR